MVKTVGRLFKNLSPLAELFNEDELALRLILGVFGDASGLGFEPL